MKRRAENHDLQSEDIGMKRIVRHKGNHDSPPSSELDCDTRKRSVTEREIQSYSSQSTSSGYDKFSSSKYGSQRDKMDVSGSVDRHSRRSFTEASSVRHTKSYSASNNLLDQIDFSLHISNLDVRPSDEEIKKVLFKEFKKFGFITVKVLGYGKERRAFINYQHYDQAHRAKKEKQNFTLFTRPIHVEWSKSTLIKYPDVASGRKPSSTSDGTSSSYLEEYHTSGGVDHRHAHSGSSQHTSSHNIGRSHDHHSGRSHDRHSGGRSHDHSRGSGGDRPLDHNKRDVSYRTSGRSASGGGMAAVDSKPVIPVLDSNATRTLFVGNLELDVTERELRDLFSQYGRIESVDIKLAKSAGTSYSFIKFTTITDAINAKNDMHGRMYGTFRLKIGFGKGSPTGKVWVGNLSSTRDLAEVRHEMDRFGLIRKCDYRDGDTHAYVHFESLDAAQAAVQALQGMRVRSGQTIKLDIHKPLHMREIEDDYSPVDRRHDQRDGNDYTSDNHHSRSRSQRELDPAPFDIDKESRDDFHHHHRHAHSKERIVSKVGGSEEEEERNYRKRSHNSQSLRRTVSHSDSLSNEYASSAKRRAVDYEDSSSHKSSKEYHHRHHHHHSKSNRTTRHDHRDEVTNGGTRKGHSSEKQDSETAPAKDNGSADRRDSSSTSEPAGPPLIPEVVASSMIMMEGDTALKLTDSTEPVSPDSDGKGAKLDSAHSETLSELGKLYPVAWRGNLVLKNTGFPARLHLVGGDPSVAEYLLRGKDEPCMLRITQRLRLEQPRLDEVNKRLSIAGPNGHCILFALPGPTVNHSGSPDEGDDSMQLRPLRSLVSYLKQKEAAGIVALNASDIGDSSDGKEVIGVLHAFPPCEFSQAQLMKVIPNLTLEPSKEDHIVVLLVKGNV